ncbi:hypothetical protein H5T88_07470 [bacterium]|nr:hypothetical protein [bacterium]
MVLYLPMGIIGIARSEIKRRLVFGFLKKAPRHLLRRRLAMTKQEKLTALLYLFR